ncbi:TonB-dependent receptor [Hyphomonas pacifica]|uniref:TonB-dependent receptor n=1 Tax=Hyphomonas pacifica TaxID=1280941 RepID=UPI000DD49759|nr:TonB-dependent receptor [Hyphomonas pacifica]
MRVLLTSVCAVALMTPVAMAQQQGDETVVRADAAATTDDDTSARRLGAVTVTATRRTQDILDVPVAVSNIGAEQMERSGISDVKQLTSIAPSLDITNTIGESYGAVIRVRGIGTSGSNPGLESATGVYVDGVYRSRSNLALNDMPGVERVELLRGPQGTLFGKNTTAGVLNVVTAKPSDEFEGSAAVTVGNLGLKRFDATIEGPLTDNLGARLDIMTMDRDGYTESEFTGQEYGGRERFQARGQLYWEPTDTVDVRVIADYTDKSEDGSNFLIYRSITPTAEALLGQFGPVPTAQDEISDYYTTPTDGQNWGQTVLDRGISAEVNWDVGPGTLTSITAWRKFDADRQFDPDAGPVDLLYDDRDGEVFESFSQELRYQGVSGDLDYLFGVFYANDKIESRDSYSFGADLEQWLGLLVGSDTLFSTVTGLPAGSVFPEGGGAYDVFKQEGDSVALFTHNTYQLTDKISITGGLRYTIDDKSLDANLTSNNPACEAAIASGGEGLTTTPAGLRGLVCIPNFDTRRDGRYTDSRSEEEFSGVLSALYRINGDLSTYASYSRGYKSGGYQFDRGGLTIPNPDGAQLEFEPEFADAYELGLKGVFMDGLVRANLALFYTELTDYQFSYVQAAASGETQRVVANLPQLTSQGVELETVFHPTEELSVNFAATYQDADFGDSDFPASLSYLEDRGNFNAPKWTLVSSANYDRDIPGTSLRTFAYLDARWQSKSNVSFSASIGPNHEQDAYATLNGRIGLGKQSDLWTIEVWGRNLTDENAWAMTGAGTLQPGTVQGYGIEPRTYGATLRVKW